MPQNGRELPEGRTLRPLPTQLRGLGHRPVSAGPARLSRCSVAALCAQPLPRQGMGGGEGTAEEATADGVQGTGRVLEQRGRS